MNLEYNGLISNYTVPSRFSQLRDFAGSSRSRQDTFRRLHNGAIHHLAVQGKRARSRRLALGIGPDYSLRMSDRGIIWRKYHLDRFDLIGMDHLHPCESKLGPASCLNL